MNKPIDPNLNDDLELDILNDTDDFMRADKDTSDGSENIMLTLQEGEHHHSSSHHHSHHHHHTSESHSHHHHTHSRHKKKKKKLPAAAKIAVVFLVLLLAAVIAIVGTFFYLEQKGKNSFTNVTTQTNYEEVDRKSVV